MELDHICLAVRKIDPAGETLAKTLGYQPRTKKVENTRQKVIVQFFSKPGSLDIKLIEPSGPDSPIVPFLKKGGGLHHLGFKSGSTQEGIESLVASGSKMTAPPEPGEAFNDGLIAFAYLGHGLNIEIFDTDARRHELE